MNILIVGNGFDLSHYLPTKYDHFMDVMEAIEEAKIESMDFDDLFSKCREEWFIEKTKQYYLTENIQLGKECLEKIRNLLNENSWYKYFKNHIQDIKTWIDFEQKIDEVLISFRTVSQQITEIKNLNSNKIFSYLSTKEDTDKITISQKNKTLLSFFKFTDDEQYRLSNIQVGQPTSFSLRKNLNRIFCYGGKIQNGFNPSLFLDYIYSQLEDFIELFNLYLDSIISQFRPSSLFAIDPKVWMTPDKIFSFNYTNTYQRFYDSVVVDYLHGSHGENQNIVLGISDLECESLKKIKAYGFTKYHQKLFKDTDYLFLDEYKKKIFNQKERILDAHNRRKGEIRNPYVSKIDSELSNLNKNNNLDLNFFIWGHSLDVSDRDYILDLFSLNDDMDRNVRVIVYHFDKPAKFSLLNNLLAILEKDKVEQWMKNGWLQFKLNPEINFQIKERAELEEVS